MMGAFANHTFPEILKMGDYVFLCETYGHVGQCIDVTLEHCLVEATGKED